MKNSHEIIRALFRTEKGTMLEPEGKYLFWVATSSNKIEIKKAVEQIYKVKVAAVNTTMVRGKNKRVRHAAGKTPDWKKAVVTLKKGQKIDIT